MAKLEQVLWCADQGRAMGREESAGLEVGPLGGDHGLASIRQSQDELQVATAVRASENLRRLTFKGVVRASDGHPLGEVLTVGSVWRCPSIPFPTAN